ncbi:ParB/RepB/Spo0J family partition protein [Kallotenue papyrolyticum]|uniref:ParB/RepB/Spo0J family partition protein n=1 Tax=Kallotenue papyrolyticum TaxID=1325125 RepID=UPI0004785BBA|nr:ParB/RepB/Spo0J family partition protein [Kallotenue papyrolyticum]
MQLVYLHPRQLEPDPEGVREDAGDIAGLAETIREYGLLQPLGVVALGGDRYRVVYGGRRQQAALHLGLERVPCIVLDGDDDLLLRQLIENVQRQDLNDMEKARSFRRLRERFKATDERLSEAELDERVAAAVGLAPRTVRRYLGLLDLPAEVQHLLRSGELSVTQAQHLRRIANPQTQIELARMIVDEGLSAAEVSQLSAYFAANPHLTVDAAMQALANNLELRTTPEPVPTDGAHLSGAAPATTADEADPWAEAQLTNPDAADDPFAAFAGDELPARTRARVARIRSLDQMVDEADRLVRAYHEGDVQKWIQQDEGAAFKLRLLLKQLRTLTRALEALVGDSFDEDDAG